MIKKLRHVGIVVRNLDETIAIYKNFFGAELGEIKTTPDQSVRAAVLTMGDDQSIELLEPVDPKGGLAEFLEEKGEGIHHICFEVDDVDRALSEAGDKGCRLIDKEGRRGMFGKIGFLNPESTKGVLIEFIQSSGN